MGSKERLRTLRLKKLLDRQIDDHDLQGVSGGRKYIPRASRYCGLIWEEDDR